MSLGYWERATRGRVSRRRAIVGTLGAAGAAAVVWGCGGSNDATLVEDEASSIIKKPVDTTKEAKIDGVYEAATPTDASGMDSLADGNANLLGFTGMVYSRLMRFKAGHQELAQGDVEGDLAQSWEVSGDGLQITIKLRPGVKWDSRTPTSGRVFDSRDVKFSWDKFSSISTQRVQLAHAASPSAPIESVSTPDANTAIFKLAFPTAVATSLLAWGPVQIQPFEFGNDTGFNPKSDARGTGPFRLKRWVPSSVLEFERNPDWCLKGFPLLAGYNRNIMPEYASRLAQFRAGAIDGGVVQSSDIIQTKADLPNLDLYASDHSLGFTKIIFGMKPGSPFLDVRVRYALALAFDRTTFDDVSYELDQFRAANFPVETKQRSFALTTGWGDWWVDPEDASANGMGAGSKYFKFDLQQAKQLMSAAGYGSGFSVDCTTPLGTLGALFDRQTQMTIGMLQELGVRSNWKQVDYTNDWLPNIAFGRGNFDGISTVNTASAVDATAQILAQYHSTGVRSTTQPGQFPEIDAQIDAAVREVDFQKRLSLVRDLQRKLAVLMPTIPWGGTAITYTLSQPWVMNQQVYRSWTGGLSPSETLYYTWIDREKKPA